MADAFDDVLKGCFPAGVAVFAPLAAAAGGLFFLLS